MTFKPRDRRVLPLEFSVFSALFEQGKRTSDVVCHVSLWVGKRLIYVGLGRKVEHGVNIVGYQDGLYQLFIQNRSFVKDVVFLSRYRNVVLGAWTSQSHF